MKYFSFPRLVHSGLALILVLPQIHAANDPITVNPKIKEISFSGDDNHTLKKDDDSKTFSAPHYHNYLADDDNPSDPLTCNYPTAFTKDTKPKVVMKFGIDMEIPENQTVKVVIKADGPDGFSFPEQTITLEHGKKIYDYPLIAGSKLPDKIRCYGPSTSEFTLTWKSKMEKGSDFTDCDTTKHRIYLTADTPSCAANYETLFYYACHKPDKNAGTDGAAVTHLIWEDFATKSMARINSDTGNLLVEELKFNPGGSDILKNGIGVCATWAEFFRDVLRVHAYTSEKVDVSTTGMTLPGEPADVLPSSLSVWLVSTQTVKDIYTVIPVSINYGQGSGHTYKEWSGHSIAKAFGELYDASYGIGLCSDQLPYEKLAISGFRYTGKDLGGYDVDKYLANDDFSRLKYTYNQ